MDNQTLLTAVAGIVGIGATVYFLYNKMGSGSSTNAVNSRV